MPVALAWHENRPMFRFFFISLLAFNGIGLLFYGMTQNYWFAGLVVLLAGWGFTRIRQRARRHTSHDSSTNTSVSMSHHSSDASSSNADCASDSSSCDSGGDSASSDSGGSDGGSSSD